ARPASRWHPAASPRVACLRNQRVSGRERGLPHAPGCTGQALPTRTRPSPAARGFRHERGGARAGGGHGGAPLVRRELLLSAGAGVTTLAAVLAIALGGRDTGTAPGKEPMQEMEGMAADGTTTMSMDESVRLSAEDVRTFGITFGTAEVRPLRKTIRTTGLVEFDETRMAYLAPKFGGWAERLHVDFTGEPVRAGQPLLDVYSPELVTAQEELLLAARMAESVGESV